MVSGRPLARAFALVCLVIAPLACGRADRAVQDAMWRMQGGAPLGADLALLDVEQVPVDKPALADAIRFVKAEGARLVVLDFAFPRRVPGDEPVVAAVQAAGAILGFRIRNADGAFAPSFPAPGWQPRDIGFVDMPVDPDGRVRSAELFRRDAAGVAFRSLALSAWLAYENRTPTDRIEDFVPVAHDSGAVAFPAHYRLAPESVIPLSKLAGTREMLSAQHYFRDKVVLIGWFGAGSRDLFLTPRADQPVPGAMLHAALFDMLRAGRGVRPVPPWLAVLVAALLGYLCGRRPAPLAVAAPACALAAWVLQEHLAPVPLVSALVALAIGAWASIRAPRAAVREVVEESSPGSLPVATSPGPLEDLETFVRTTTGGRYGELSPLTKGGMGQIHLARDLRLDRPVVVKAMAPELARAGDEFRQRFARESRLQAKVAAAGLPVILDSHAEAAQPFVVMEYVEGESLQALVKRRGALPAPEVVALGRELAGMLAVLHRHRVWHRDLKPLNLMIDRTGRLRLLDLGLATTESEQALTAAGRAMGTPGYMSPEQERGDPCAAPADIYAFGAVLFELLTTSRPVPGLRTAPVEFAVLPDPEPLVRVAAPPALADAILRCLAPEPGQRPRSFRAVERALANRSDAAADRAVIERVEAMRRQPRLMPASAAASGPRWERLIERVRAELAGPAPADDVTGVALPGVRSGGRLTRLFDHFRVPVAARLHAVLARLPVQLQAAYRGEPALPTPYPLYAAAHLDTIALKVAPPGARVKLAADAKAVLLEVEAPADTRQRAHWDALSALVRELGGTLTASDAGCAVRLPFSAQAWVPRA